LIEHETAPAPRTTLPAFDSKVDRMRPTYGFEDVSLAPGIETIEPNDVELGQSFCGIELGIPILAAAMDAVVDPGFAGALGRLGGLAFLNLEGVQGRYDDPTEVLERIATAPDDEVQTILSEAYGAPIQEDLIARRLE
jgi:IMP dehydrogenase